VISTRSNVRYIVDDVDAAIDFYGEHLGFTVETHPAPGFAQLSREGLRLLLNAPGAGGGGQAGGNPQPGGWNRFQLTVDDLQSVVDELERAGATFRGEIVEGAGGRQIVLEDPAGNPVELLEPATSAPVQPIPADVQSLTPFLSIDDVAAFMEFVASTFGASAAYVMRSTDGVVRHCRLDIAGSQLMVSSGTDRFPPMPCMLHLYVEDVDATYQSAIDTGAVSLREPTDEFYGDRTAGVEDRWRNQWWLATHIEDVSPEEMERRERNFRERAVGDGDSR
jgi:uncharacterized glyoxalase superfamily protein PhnB/predicted enzyme related to lactoylglutathione lyase